MLIIMGRNQKERQTRAEISPPDSWNKIITSKKFINRFTRIKSEKLKHLPRGVERHAANCRFAENLKLNFFYKAHCK